MEVEPGKYLVRILSRGGKAEYYLVSWRRYFLVRISQTIIFGLFALIFLCNKFVYRFGFWAIGSLILAVIAYIFLLQNQLSEEEAKKYKDRLKKRSLGNIGIWILFIMMVGATVPKKYWPTFILDNKAFMHWNCETCYYDFNLCDVKSNPLFQDKH